VTSGSVPEAAGASSGAQAHPAFMAGINVEGDDVRDVPEKVVELLKPTPIRWVRVHLLPTRRLDDKGPNGTSYMDGLEHLCRSGYSIIAPIDVGYTDNVGKVPADRIDAFIEESYDFSFKASKRIAEVAERNGVGVIFGIENEIDMKSWLLQSLPDISWRGTFETWAALALDRGLRYRRLDNILRGTRDAVPGARTMTNLDAEDAFDAVEDAVQHLTSKHQETLEKLSVPVEDIEDELVDWRSELEYMKGKLGVDIIGLDSYPDYVFKYPVLGGEIALKVADAERISGKPVFNPEFGYSTYRNFPEKVLFGLSRRPDAEKMQLQFFRNALGAIGKTSSCGTFPWVLITHVDRRERPEEEAYFGLFAMRGEALTRRSAFDYYVEWLRSRAAAAQEQS
jgi:hypothetical protein